MRLKRCSNALGAGSFEQGAAVVDGCNLYVTEYDVRQITESLHLDVLAARSLTSALEPRQARQLLESVPRDRIVKILEVRTTPAARALGRLLMTATAAQKNLNPDDALRVPDAFRIVFKDHPAALGVFVGVSGERGHGSSGILHGGEILSASALKQGDYITSSGLSLRIEPQDHIDFGLKHAGEFSARKRGKTLETDILIQQPVGLLESARIGVDVKYSKQGKYGATSDLKTRLAAVRNALSDGQLDRFVYVTQGEFSDPFLELIEEINRDLVIDWMNEKGEDVALGPYLTSEERAPVPDLDPRVIDDMDRDEILDLARTYRIGIVETCEHVTVPQ